MPPLGRPTIYGIMTPSGRSALAAIRISGPDSAAIVERLTGVGKLPAIGQLRPRRIFDPQTGDLLDEAMVVLFAGPRSYTGEDVAEIHLHGSPVLLQHLVSLLPTLGAGAAEPGEFTLRAFLNGKKDLAQAEAVQDLVEAQSVASVRCAAKGVSGALSAQVRRLQDCLMELLTQLEAELDFPDDVVPLLPAELRAQLEVVVSEAEILLAGYQRARLVKEGFRVVLAGPPNVGKSSLFNALLGRDRSIVTPEAGTTRDYLEEYLHGTLLPIILVDTAGLREVETTAEAMGVERSKDQLSQADLVLALVNPFDSGSSLPFGSDWSTGADVHLVHTHADLRDPRGAGNPPASVLERLGAEVVPAPWAVVSSKTLEGIETLRRQICDFATVVAMGPDNTLPLVANARQAEALNEAREMVQEAVNGCAELPVDILASMVRKAVEHLGLMTGETLSEQILHQIFSRFCIGK